MFTDEVRLTVVISFALIIECHVILVYIVHISVLCQARVATENALRDMTLMLLNDPSKSLKDKQRHLAALSDNHPLIFTKYFSTYTPRA